MTTLLRSQVQLIVARILAGRISGIEVEGGQRLAAGKITVVTLVDHETGATFPVLGSVLFGTGFATLHLDIPANDADPWRETTLAESVARGLTVLLTLRKWARQGVKGGMSVAELSTVTRACLAQI